MAYVRQGPFVDNSAPDVTAAKLNAIEDGIVTADANATTGVTNAANAQANALAALALIVQPTIKNFAPANPTDLASTFRNHPDGVYVFNCPRAGRYRVTLQDFVRHTGPYTYENTSWGIAGTATRLDNGLTFDAWLPSAGQDGNRSITHVAWFDATAGQTITVGASFRMGAASGTAAAHTFAFSAVFELVSA